MILIWTPAFHSVRTIGNRVIQYSCTILICPDALNAIDLTTLSIIGRKHCTAKKTQN